ncbi:MAG: DUF2520 domain-containing protein [Bacteroidaceae bacterium]
MKISLIGAGRLATNLAFALKSARHEVVSVLSRSEISSRRLAETVGCAWTTDFRTLRRDADVYVVAVSDDAVTDVVNLLGQVVPDALVVHTAGSLSMDVFKNSGLKHFGVFYPMQTFSKERKVDFHTVSCFVEACDVCSLESLKLLAESLGCLVYELNSSDRRYLHLAAVIACNFSNHCYAMAEDVLKQCGIPFKVLLPLIDETVLKIHRMSAKDAQTGPAVRNDSNVICAQESLLEGNPDYKEIYTLMSHNIQKIREVK